MDGRPRLGAFAVADRFAVGVALEACSPLVLVLVAASLVDVPAACCDTAGLSGSLPQPASTSKPAIGSITADRMAPIIAGRV